MENKIFPLLASILFLASCDASDLRPKRGGPPPMSHSRDRYACQINDEGYVYSNEFGIFKLVNREQFSYANFNNTKFSVV